MMVLSCKRRQADSSTAIQKHLENCTLSSVYQSGEADSLLSPDSAQEQILGVV